MPSFCQKRTAAKLTVLGLHREVNRHFRPSLANQVDQPGVSHDQCVGLEGDDRRHIDEIAVHLAVVRQDVAHHVKLSAGGVRFADGAGKLVEVTEVVIAYPQAVARLPRVNRVGAKGQGRAQHRQRAGGGE
jgi:hypothetical protein